MKVLTDKSKNLATLFNCRLNNNATKILCGVAIFKGGMSGELFLLSEHNQEFKIKIPDYVQENQTLVINSSPKNNLEIELC